MARSKYRRLPPSEGADRFAAGDPDLLITLADALKEFGMNFEQVRPFLASGELTAYVLERRGPHIKPAVRAHEWTEFLGHHPELWDSGIPKPH